jgi:hypothetical protein
VEVCLDGELGRGYRKWMSAIPAGFGGWEALEGGREDTGEGCQSGGRGENPALPRLLFVEEGGTCPSLLYFLVELLL